MSVSQRTKSEIQKKKKQILLMKHKELCGNLGQERTLQDRYLFFPNCQQFWPATTAAAKPQRGYGGREAANRWPKVVQTVWSPRCGLSRLWHVHGCHDVTNDTNANRPAQLILSDSSIHSTNGLESSRHIGVLVPFGGPRGAFFPF